MNLKIYITLISLIICTFAVNAQGNKQLVVNETWNNTGNTKKMCYFYGPTNQLVRSRNYKRDEEGTGWTIVDYSVYNYDNNLNLTDSYTQPYRLVNGEMTKSTIYNRYAYEYNTKGQLVKITYPYSKTCVRTYDSDGHYIKGDSIDGQNTYTIEQSDFTSEGKPCKITCSSLTSDYASANYTIHYTYDANGNVLTEYKCSTTPSTSYSTNWLKEFEYNEDGTLSNISQWVLNSDGTTNYIKYYTTYEYETNGTQLRITEKKFSHASASSTTYTHPTTWNVYVYDEVDGNKYSPTFTISNANNLGTATCLTISIPDPEQSPTLHIYRNGFEVGTGITFEPNADGVMQYIDEGLKNGEYEYFVEWENHNISEIVNYNLQLALPAATNLRVTSSRIEQYKGEQGEIFHSFYATVEWDAPGGTRNGKLDHYDVYVNNSKGPVNLITTADTKDEDGTADRKFEIMLQKDENEVYIQSVYDVGKANSESICILKAEIAPSKGDVNADDSVDLEDASLVLDMLLGKSKYNDYGDLDGNESITIGDLSNLIRLIKAAYK